jgi:hypothetical protein
VRVAESEARLPIVSEHSTFGLTAEILMGSIRLRQQAFGTEIREVQIVLDPQASYWFVNGAPNGNEMPGQIHRGLV